MRKKKVRLVSILDDNEDKEEEEDHQNNTDVDRISDLPNPILHHILSFLPIKCIAQTSVLSKQWRSLWSSFPDLDFTTLDKHVVSMHFMTQVLALRDKHCHLRTLHFRASLTFSHLNALVRCAIRHQVQELNVEVSTHDFFNFPRAVIASESLRVFKLKSHYPGFRLLPSSVMSKGFPSLHTLSLSLVALYQQSSLVDLFTESSFPNLKKLNLDSCSGMKRLKVSCRALEDLTIENCFQLSGLEIYGSRLERLRVLCSFDSYCDESWVKMIAPKLSEIWWLHNAITDTIYFQKLDSLSNASVGFSQLVLSEYLSVQKLQSVCNLLSALSHAHTLTLDPQCLEVLSIKDHFAHHLHPFNKLKILELHTSLDKNNVPGLALLFRNSPNLHTLILKIINDYKTERRQWNRDLWDVSTSSKEEQYWESQIQKLKPFLDNLKIVRIDGFLECENEVSLAKFLLKHGKDLQEMTLRTAQCNHRDSLRRQKVRSQMMGFSWASSNAKIAFIYSCNQT